MHTDSMAFDEENELVPFAARQIIGLYQRHAATWTKLRGDRLIERSWLDKFLSKSNRGPILDIGCGSGVPIARYLIQNGRQVVGIDSSPQMIAMCREHHPQGDWHISDMRTLRLGKAFGGILAWDSLFHLHPEDQRKMFPIFGAHANPGAPLMFTSGPAFGEAIGDLAGEPLYHASLDRQEYLALLNENGFTVLDHVVEDQNCGGRTVWLSTLD
jgi:SAM-dependent methyltransferase